MAAHVNRRFLGAAACGLALFFVVDWWLYSRLGFLQLFGQATQEGQIVSKVRRAGRMAGAADVIAFGSSYVRSGVSGEPFLARGLLLWNFGISGAGPLTSYFALKTMAPAIAARPLKPLLLLELRAEALARNQGTVWAEYPQYLGIVRTRQERLGEAPFVLSYFREAGMTSQFVSSLVVPSGIYRSHAIQVFQRAWQSGGYFYGMEDVTGYSPLYTVAMFVPDINARPAVAYPRSAWLDGKVAAIRKFLQLAGTLGCRVVLFSSPSQYLTKDAAIYDGLAEELTSEFHGVSLLRKDEYPLQSDDFEGGGHLNIRGADKISRFLIERLRLRAGDLAARTTSAFDAYTLAPASWTIGEARLTDAATIDFDGSASLDRPYLATSPPINVVPDRECVLELRTEIARGRLDVFVWWRNRRTGRLEQQQVVTDPGVSTFGRASRTFVRSVPRADQVWIQIRDDGAVNGYETAVGRVEALRFWSNRL